MREKLIELFENDDCPLLYVLGENMGRLADYLIEKGVTVQKWIPVKESLPEKDGYYLAVKDLFGNDGIVRTVGFTKNGKKISKYDFQGRWKNVWYDYDSEYGYITIDSVTHWMPLPEPPKENDNDLPKM